MKKIALSAVLAAGVFGLTACSSSDSEVVVETSGGEVTKEEFYEALKDQSGQQVLQRLVLEEVLSNKYEVSEEEVDAELEAMKEQYGDSFEMVLQQYGMASEEEFKDTIRLSLLQEKVASEGIEITEEEMKQYYERMQTEVKASHILVEDQETAEEVKQKLEEGASFEELAKEYSVDSSAQSGGDLGYFGPGKMVPVFEDAAYSLEVGEVSDIVESEFGFHIIKVTDKREVEDVEPYEDVKDDIRRTLISQQVDQQELQTRIDELLREAEIDVKIDDIESLFPNLEQPEEPAPEEGSEGNSGEGEGSESESSGEDSSSSEEGTESSEQ